MKRIAAIILALAMTFALASCGGGSGTANPPASTAPESSTPVSAAPETTVPSGEPTAGGPSFDTAVKMTFATSGKAGSLSAIMDEVEAIKD